MQRGKKPKIGIKTILFASALVISLIMAPALVETVEKGTYQVKQAAITGEMSAKMTPGIWGQWFGDIDVWPKAETFFFTADKDTDEDTDGDLSIEVRFNDGSMARISGTARVIMPITESDAIALTTERGHKTYKDVQQKLILPTIRNVLRSTANLMSARESYNENRLDFISWSRDQITNGVYKTEEATREVEDLVTGEKTWKKVKIIRTNDAGDPLYEPNPMDGTGIELKNFEIKTFVYEDKVRKQIAKQQEARMNVETAKAKAEEARQEELRTVAEGKQKVAAAKYEEEQAKIRAVVAAEKEKEVAEIAAARKVEVAKQARLEAEQFKLKAEEIKQANILEGQGLAEKKRLIIEADGALQQKLDAIVTMNRDAMDAFAKRAVPTNYFAGGNGAGEAAVGGYDEEMIRQLRLMNLRLLDGVKLDMTVKQ